MYQGSIKRRPHTPTLLRGAEACNQSFSVAPAHTPVIIIIIVGNIGVLLGLYWDNGKGNGNRVQGLGLVHCLAECGSLLWRTSDLRNINQYRDL